MYIYRDKLKHFSRLLKFNEVGMPLVPQNVQTILEMEQETTAYSNKYKNKYPAFRKTFIKIYDMLKRIAAGMIITNND